MDTVLLDSDTHRVAKLISSLGGPSVDQRDIEWANDLENGRLLLHWLSSQIPGNDDDLDNPIAVERLLRDAGLGTLVSAAMRDSTLETEEVTISNDERVSQYVAQSEHIPEYLPDYMPPSQLKKHADFVADETRNVQQEAALFRTRISQTKEASKKINNTIKLLQRAMYDLNTKLRSSEETLSELSITADTTISATIAGSQELLLGLGMSLPRKEGEHDSSSKKTEAKLATQDEYADLEAARKLLSKSKGNIATFINRFQESTANFDQLSQEDMTKAVDLQTEAKRLQSAFDAIESRTKPKTRKSSDGSKITLDGDVVTELQALCDTLEKEVSLRDRGQASGGGTLDSLLSELHEGYIADKEGAKVQQEPHATHEQLRQAWALDQAAILQLHAEALDEALFALTSTLAPLERLYVSLARLAECVQEAEAALEACAEELGDIYLDGLQSQDEESQSQRDTIAGESQDELDDIEMEQRIKDALNDCKHLRPADVGPLVLLTREDILAELRLLKARSARVEEIEITWADAVIQKYSIRPIHPLLPQIYAHAPTNTFPPFAFPTHVRALETRARSTAAELHGLAQAVDEEVSETFVKEGNAKRLDAFVEKWAGIGEKKED